MASVQVLGRVAAFVSNHQEIPLRGRRTREFLAALACRAGEPIPRERLWGWIWPDAAETAARKSLNTEMWRLKCAIRDAGSRPAKWFKSTPDSILLRTDSDVKVDLSEFRGKIDQEDSLDGLIDGCQLYQADFATDVPSDWAENERRVIRQRFLDILRRASGSALAADRLPDALRLAQRLHEEDPYNEQAVRALMRTQVAQGQNSAAVLQYQKLERLLASELGVVPSPRTDELYQTCRTGGGSADAEGGPGFHLEMVPLTPAELAEARRCAARLGEMFITMRHELRILSSSLDKFKN